MDTDNILEKYGLTRDTAAQYIDAITQMNQSETAEELDVSRKTINRYKHAFREMTRFERSLIIATLTQEALLEDAAD
jgi:DNA-binding XRE family transcriptional regulator